MSDDPISMEPCNASTEYSDHQIAKRLDVLTGHMIFMEAFLKELVCRIDPAALELLATKNKEGDKKGGLAAHGQQTISCNDPP